MKKTAELHSRDRITVSPIITSSGTVSIRVGPGKNFDPVLEREFAVAFENLGAWSGPSASTKGTKANIDFWRRGGEKAVDWLIERLRNSGNETSDAASTVLAKLGSTALKSILRALEAQPTFDQAYSLLRSIARAGTADTNLGDTLITVLRRYVTHPDSDVREAAISATAALPSEKAIQVLTSALSRETDPIIISTIKEELEERSSQ